MSELFDQLMAIQKLEIAWAKQERFDDDYDEMFPEVGKVEK